MLHPLCLFKNAIVPRAEVRLELNDLALLRGFGVFDYLRTYNGMPFRLHDYLDRFSSSVSLLGMDLPVERSWLADGIEELISRTRHLMGVETSEHAIRLLLTGGPSEDALTSTEPTLLVLLESAPPDYPSDRERGVKLLSCEYLRDVPAAKSTNYLNAVRLAPEMKRQGASEILYHWNGKVLEASRANIFAVFGDLLVTPREQILLGITRRTVLEHAAAGFGVEERELTLEELRHASEVFFTGSGRRIVPVVQIDERTVGNGIPGPRTRQILERFDAFTGGTRPFGNRSRPASFRQA